MKINNRGMLSIFVMANLALAFAIYSVSVSAELTEPDMDKTSVQVGDTITVSGYPGDVTSGATIKIYWDVAINEWLLNTTTGNPDGSYDVEVDVPDTLNGTHWIWVEDTATSARVKSADITVNSEIDSDVSSGLPGDDLEVTGTGFGDTQPVNITLYNQTAAGPPVVVSWSATVIDYSDNIDTDEYGTFVATFEIPSILDYGIYTINATDGYNVAEVNFTAGVAIALSPDEGPTGTVVTVEGRGWTPTVNISFAIGATTVQVVDNDEVVVAAGGTFTAEIVIPDMGSVAEYIIEATEFGGAKGPAEEDFDITGVPEIVVSPTYGSPGATITVTGSNFTQIADTEVVVELWAEGTTTWVADLVIAETDADGTFEDTFVSPAVTFTSYDVGAVDAVYDLDAVDSFKVGLIALIVNPTSGESGTGIAIIGIGFADGTYSLTFGDELYEDHGTVTAEAISDPFYVPNVEPGTYDLTVIDTEENELTAQFTVTESTYVSMDPALGSNDHNVTIEGFNFADKVGTVDFVLYNSTDEWFMNVWEDGAGSVPAATDVDGNFTGWWEVHDADTLSIGDYTINITDSQDLMVQLSFSVVAARVEVTPRKALFDRGDTISFDISNDFDLPDSYIEIYSPYDTLYWITDPFTVAPTDMWVLVDDLYTVPYYRQTANSNPMELASDAPMGTWTYFFYDSDDEALMNGTFTVGPAMIINPTSGSAGTEVALASRSFKTGESWIITFDDEQLSFSWDIVYPGEIVITFFVPSASPGEHDMALVTESGSRYDFVFTVTDETRIILDQTKVQPGAILGIQGENYASGSGLMVDLAIEGVSLGNVLTGAGGVFFQNVSIPSDLRDGLYKVTARQGQYLIGAEAIIQIQRAQFDAESIKDSYFPGESIRFDIQSAYTEEDSYIQIRDPQDNSYFVTDPFSEDVWITVETNEMVPVYSQTAEGNPMTLPVDAPLGEWGWTWYDGRINVLDFGSFLVVSGQPTADIDTPSDTTFYKSEGIEFRGHGTDPDGWITGYRWEADGRIMSEQDSFTTSFEESGIRAVLFSVMDQDGIWSEPVTLSLDIKSYLIKINDFYVQPEHVVVTTGAGATATGVAISQLPKPTPKKIHKIHKKKELKRQKKQERRNKKRKGKPLIFWSIAGSDFLYNRNGEVSIKLHNVGFAKAKNITIDLYNTYGLKLEKTHINIPELDVQKKDEVTIGFQLMPFARNGLFKIVARINTRTLLEERKVHFITVLKTGLLMPHPNDNQDKIIEWLDKSEYHWSSFSNPENYLNLMEYDLLFITNSELSKKSVNNLKIYTMMGNKIVVNDRVRKREPELMDLLGYREIDKEEIKVETSYVQFDTGDHPLLKGTNINSLKKETEFLTLSQLKIGTGKVISTANYLKNDVKLSLPLITVNKIQDGHVIHINYVANGDQNGVHSNTKNIINYVLDSLYLEKKVPTKGRLWKK